MNLSKSALFAGISESEYRAMLHCFETYERTYAAGETIGAFREKNAQWVSSRAERPPSCASTATEATQFWTTWRKADYLAKYSPFQGQNKRIFWSSAYSLAACVLLIMSILSSAAPRHAHTTASLYRICCSSSLRKRCCSASEWKS